MMNILKFNELSINELYAILRLRTEVFVVEQNCPYQECDDLDQTSIHFFIKNQDEIIAYLRLIPPTQSSSTKIGRVVVKKSARQKGLGIELMQAAIRYYQNHYTNTPLKISAQQYLDRFYSNLGFKNTGNKYLEDGIPHQEMIFNR